MSVIFVGMNPGRPTGRRSGTMRRFATWLNYLGLRYVSFVNLSFDERWNGKVTNDKYLIEVISGHDKIIAWGDSVSSHLRRLGFPDHFVLPHPSGRNRKLNDDAFVQERLSSCYKYLHGPTR